MLLPSTKGPGFGHCKYCHTDINITHGGVYDVNKHLSSSKHQEMVRAVGSSGNVRQFFQQSLAAVRPEGKEVHTSSWRLDTGPFPAGRIRTMEEAI